MGNLVASTVKWVTRSKQLIADAGWVLALRIVRQLAALALTVVLVRAISTAQFGNYHFILSVVSLCALFYLPGMQIAVTQSVARGFLGTYRVALRWSLIGGVVGSLVLGGIAAWFWFHENTNLGAALIVAALLFPLSQAMGLWRYLYNGQAKFRAIAFYVGGASVATSAVTILALWLGVKSLSWLIAIAFGALAIRNLWITWRASRDYDTAQDKGVEPGSLRYGAEVSIYSTVNNLANNADRILIFALLSPEILAIYAAAYRLSEMAKDNLQSLAVVIMPRLAKMESYTKRIDTQFNVVGLVIAAGTVAIVFLVLPWLVPLLYSDRYLDAVLISQLLLCSLIFTGFSIPKATYINSKLDAVSFRGVHLYGSGIRLIASVILVPIYGLYGAVAATAIYRLAVLVLTHYHLRKFHKFQD